MAPETVRVVVVDDHPILRDGTRALIDRTPGLQVVGVAGDGATTLALVAELQPDVLMLDVGLPDMSGIEVAQEVHARFPSVAVVLLTGYNAQSYAPMLPRLGVRGLVHKTAPSEALVAAIQAVAEGQAVMAAPATPRRPPIAEPLTAREHQVLDLIAAGRRNAEVAAELHVSLNTVEFHVRHILGKLGVRSRTEAVVKGRELGYALSETLSR
jgi:DNA-binding NarL/FixJ family response regulator